MPLDLPADVALETPGPRAELRVADITVRFMLAGHAYVTFQSERTGTRFTYKIAQGAPRDGKPSPHFVAVLAGPDHYEYLGCIFGRKVYMHGRKSRVSREAPSAKAFTWCWAKLSAGHMPTTLAVYHEGRCGACGRRLTTPESIETGLGPVCAKRAGGSV